MLLVWLLFACSGAPEGRPDWLLAGLDGDTGAPSSDTDTDSDTDADTDGDTDTDDHTGSRDTATDTDTGDTGTWGGGRFRDRTSWAGIGLVHWTPSSHDYYECFSGGHTVAGGAAGDLDGDGYDDLVVTRYGSAPVVFANQGNGQFVDVQPRGLQGGGGDGAVSLADVDDDGDLDIYTSSMGYGPNRLYINQGNFLFIEVGATWQVNLRPSGCNLRGGSSFSDVDLDGDLDLLAASWTNAYDRDEDGLGNRSAWLVNQGGSYSDRSETSGLTEVFSSAYASAFADFDGDGFDDLYLSADWQTSKQLHYQDGLWVDQTMAAGTGTEENGMGVATGDIDGDGDVDLFSSSIAYPNGDCLSSPEGLIGCSGNRLFRNRGDGTFDDITTERGVRDGGWAWDTRFFDYDNDGDLDLLQTNGQIAGVDWPYPPDSTRLWRNDGDAVWPEVAFDEGLIDAGLGRGLLTFDPDRDGDLDVVVLNNLDGPVFYENTSAYVPWLVVQARGRGSNHFGIGVKVEVEVSQGAPVQTRWIRANGGFSGTNPPEAHFGLGAHQGPVYQVRLSWPVSGQTQILEGVSVDQVLVVDEP